MPLVEDVVIVGGGPAGGYCAFELARKGLYAMVLDHSHPREKPCGGGIQPSVLEKFPLLKKPISECGVYSQFKMISCTGREAIVSSKKAFNVSRKCFDAEILGMAIQNGAQLIREKVIDIQKKQGLWKVKTTNRVLSTRIVVGADGANSLVRRKTAGAFSKENLALTFGYFASNVEKEFSVVKFLDEIPGYIWIFPRKSCASVGIGSELKYGSKLRKLLDNFISLHCPHIKAKSKFSVMLPSATNPNFFTIPCAGEDWILVGDAAGHVDPITGGGILYALWSGKLAAEAMCRNDLKSYDESWTREYGNLFKKRCKEKNSFYDPLMTELRVLECSGT